MRPLYGDNPTPEQTGEKLTYQLTLTDHEGVVIDYTGIRACKPLLTMDDVIYIYVEGVEDVPT